mmetsp:Transcript_49278/g.107239  ORF Transcript_49278/g.107239 Transcript_49278/m.107239 type:complete len:690 (+) Transcript_49278:106-2175(+)|eukprot:CAMPEP_0170602164 /NCGR_PEP_ID=MMETSP0224-20130122/18246_1 /TAXON_ID=285029 /ORGANISM="Togula jolla, Strain CCCM 725" /LENGTH=689 /DNA_ID=CAMNT_0010926987 /DNA_START=63 /DNA_END=2132 /DNA_ORIENTATION=+
MASSLISDADIANDRLLTASATCIPNGPIQDGFQEHLVHISMKPPTGEKRQPSDIACVIDISGSMGSEATIRGAAGAVESNGLTMLDVAKHGVMTIAHSLGADDRLAIIVFNYTARVLVNLTAMDEQGREEVQKGLDDLMQGGGTNLYEGLHHGLETLFDVETVGRFPHVMVLTDGASMDPNTIVPKMIELMKSRGGFRGTVNTFAFGYNLDSEVLTQISEAGSGCYSFIPDAGFVGTAFVNMVSNLLVTMATGVKITLKPMGGAKMLPMLAKIWPIEDDNTICIGPIQYGQTKDLVLAMNLPEAQDDPYLQITVTCSLRCQSEQHSFSVDCQRKVPASNADAKLAKVHLCRYKFLDAIYKATLTKAMVAEAQAATQSSGTSMEDFRAKSRERSFQIIQEVQAEIEGSGVQEEEAVKSLLEDISGQAFEAFGTNEAYQRWGKHYMPSVGFAHKHQVCNNFKDPGVQNYGSELFSRLRDDADDAFNQLPPPKPSLMSFNTGAGAGAPISMAMYNDRYGGCISGDSIVELEGGKQCRVSELSKGDRLAALGGGIATLELLVRTSCPCGRAKLVELAEGLRITPYHPVQMGKEWCFPAELGQIVEFPCAEVFSFALKGSPAAFLGGIPCVALGHGIKEGAAAHPYFGTSAVLEDLKRFRSSVKGLVDLPAGCEVRDSTGNVCGLRAKSSSVV